MCLEDWDDFISTIKFSVSHADSISALSEFSWLTSFQSHSFQSHQNKFFTDKIISTFRDLQAMGEEMICAVKTVNN
jgi:hypothetical protein